VTIHLIHWNETEALQRITQLQGLGHQVAYVPYNGGGVMKHIRASAPHALLIDLTRMPSHGKAVAIEMRRQLKLRTVPIVFAEGDPAKVAPLRELFPDAVFTMWASIGPVLKKLKPVADPVVPVAANSFERYAGTPLHKKLGLKPGMNVALVNPPPAFDRVAADFPDGITWQHQPQRDTHLVFLYADSQATLEADFALASRFQPPVWVFWPKQASGVKTDLTQHVARTFAHGFGYTDCKVCSFDATWSGFLFRLKRE
jgi:hypothetical protein